MPFVVEKNIALDPMNVGFVRSIAVMSRADRLADLIEEFWLRRRCRRIDGGAALESISVQRVYLGAFRVVSSRSQRRLGFNCTRSPFTEINFSSQGLSITVISWSELRRAVYLHGLRRLECKLDLSVLNWLEQLGREFSDPRQSLS